MAKQEKEKNNQKHFWRDFRAELKKVIWPSKKQLINNTLVVIGMVLATTIIVLVLDLAFEALNTYGINKIKEAVQDSVSTTVDGEDEHDHDHDHEEGEGDNAEATGRDSEEDDKTSEEE